MTVQLIQASAKSLPLADESVQCVVTSPPYWGLRKYSGDQEAVWGGSPECEHEWSVVDASFHKGQVPDGKWKNQTAVSEAGNATTSTCSSCGAWRGAYGLEPTIELYVQHTVEILREIRRVLRKDGVCFWNVGDSYANDTKWGGHTGGKHAKALHGDDGIGRGKRNSGLKGKDLCLMPFRVALAAQADGWWVRSDIIWCLSGGAWLYARTQKGEMPVMVKDLVRLDPKTVQLWNGERWTQVLSWSQSSDSTEPLELVLRSGERIGCTRGHLWPTQRGTVLASDLAVGDVIQTCFLPEPQNATTPPYLTDDLAWLIGLYLAEGSRADDTIQLSLHADETSWLPRISRAASHAGASVTHSTDSGSGLNVRIYGRVLNAIIADYVGGAVAKDKHLNVKAWALPNKTLRQIVEGYLAGDGHIEESRIRLGFCRNYALERDLRTLAARLEATITLNLATVHYQGGSKPSFRGEWRWERSGHHNEKSRSEVVEIRASRARKFWDIAVADEPHLFSLASGVLTHNCKPNPMPESVTDRPTDAYEHILMFTKSQKYFWDAAAVAEPLKRPDEGSRKTPARFGGADKFEGIKDQSRLHSGNEYLGTATGTRNIRNVWTFATQPYKGAHFATFPEELPRRCILAASKVGDTVLDPFGGSGTTGKVAVELQRNAVLCDVAYGAGGYRELAEQRIAQAGTRKSPPVRKVDVGQLMFEAA